MASAPGAAPPANNPAAAGPKKAPAPMARMVGRSLLNIPASGRPVSGFVLSGSLNTRPERPLSAPISESVI